MVAKKKKKSVKLVKKKISKKRIINRHPSKNDKASKVKKIKAYQKRMRARRPKGFFSRLFGRR